MSSLDQGRVALQLFDVGVSYRIRTGMLKSRLHWALKNISFDLYHGETLGVIGRNGAGKSTLLRLLSGILAPDQGELDDFGNSASLLALKVGFVPHLTGRENAVISGMLLGLSHQEMIDKLPDIMSFSELGDFIDQQTWTYSAGMKARLGFAVAFQADPDIILIDEVLGVGDKQFNAKSTELMHEKIHSDKTIVIVSHNMETIREHCDRVIWIEDGTIKMQGGTADVLAAYV